MAEPGSAAQVRRAGRRVLACAAMLAGLLVGAPGGVRAQMPAAAQADPPAPLRVCMDPDNAPFSSSKPNGAGFYYELAQHVASVMGRPFQPVWTLGYFGKRSVRTTLLAKECDAYMGLPQTRDFMGPSLLFSHPVLQLGYVLVLPPGRSVNSLADLKGLRVAVQFASPPQSLIATHADITTVTVIETAEAIQALADKRADAAFIWGPTAGYLNKTAMHEAYRVVPVAGPDMQWTAAIGFARDQTAQRDAVNAALDASADAVRQLEAKYGFPTGAEQTVDLASQQPPPANPNIVPAVARPQDGRAWQIGNDVPVTSAAASQADVAAGKDVFNGTCAHCHGPDGVQADHHIDLRRLKLRYGDDMDQVFETTVHNGRPDKGMPNWSGVFSDEDLDRVKAWLHTVQVPAGTR